jgi:peptidyl-tRNA hydrolase, PTH1 family
VHGNPWGKHVVVVGLGNPGASYSRHRHNLGFMVVDHLARQVGASWRKTRDKADVCDIRLENQAATLVKPLTFMNLSGKAVSPIVRRLNADPARMIVIHDDLDLALGRVRIKVGGGDGGHKGVRSIADSLRFRDFIRVRLGIGRPHEGINPERFVLMSFDPEEGRSLTEIIGAAGQAVITTASHGVVEAQNAFHSKKLTGNGAST